MSFHREWPGYSPTVNVSWFIAKAYLANLYYTNHDSKSAVETCDEVVQTYQSSIGNKYFAERCFPVLLSTQWTAIYDGELQALLGLSSLCAFVSNKRSVCFAVSPVQFALYLKLRCIVDSGYSSEPRRYSKDFREQIEHNNECIFDRAYFGRILLSTAILINHKVLMLHLTHKKH